jgi:hypothetical protein
MQKPFMLKRVVLVITNVLEEALKVTKTLEYENRNKLNELTKKCMGGIK